MRESYSHTPIIWGVPWTMDGTVWVGPTITDPENAMLATAVEYERIIRRDGRNVLVDPGLTLDRFGWDEDDVTITEPEEDADA